MRNLLKQEHSGAVAFEYIIILVIMAVCIFTAWDLLGDAVVAKARQIKSFIESNGQNNNFNNWS